jgi:GNAT superfamily N-acetyltransferase
VAVRYEWRGTLRSAEVEALHAEGFGHPPKAGSHWRSRLERHSLGWVCARQDRQLVGFVNVAWDGRSHAFLLDTVVALSHRRRGIGSGLVALAVREATDAGCEWLHVDFEDDLQRFYLTACGFQPTKAGLLRIRSDTSTRR